MGFFDIIRKGAEKVFCKPIDLTPLSLMNRKKERIKNTYLNYMMTHLGFPMIQ